jgi:hypothetical protein
MPRGGRLDEVRECKISSKDKAEDANLPPDAYNIDRKTIEEDEKYEYCYSLPAKPAWELRKLDLATGQFRPLAATTAALAQPGIRVTLAGCLCRRCEPGAA